jgi:hypothetical protein
VFEKQVGENVNYYINYVSQYGGFLKKKKKLKEELSCELTLLLLGVYLKECK